MRDQWGRVVVALASGSLLHVQTSRASISNRDDGGGRYDQPRAAAVVKPTAPQLATLAVQNVRLELAPPLEESSSVTLKFDVHNEGLKSLTDIVLTVSLVEMSEDDHADDLSAAIAGPFIVRAKAPLAPGQTLSYEIRLRNISVDCGCLPRVNALAARVLQHP